MKLGSLLLTLHLITFNGPDGQLITINRNDVVSIRKPRAGDHFATGTKCLIHLSDGKFVPVQQECEEVINKLTEEEE